MEHLDEAISLAKKEDMDFVVIQPEWKGKPMCELRDTSADDEDNGYPCFCMFEKGHWRLLETGIESECTDYMRFLDEEYGVDDNGHLIGFEEERIRA